MTYSEAYDKIIQAYFKDELEPYQPNFCFCGNLCDKTDYWFVANAVNNTHNASHGYSGLELFEMEQALLRYVNPGPYTEYEDNLFEGMAAALEVLKQIHISRGEIIDEAPTFTKRLIPA